MGSIKQTFIKRTGEDIYKNYKDRITKDFEKNKKVLNELIESNILICRSKELRNKLAGYLATRTENTITYKVKPAPKYNKKRRR